MREVLENGLTRQENKRQGCINMVVSNIKPIRKSVNAYSNYIFGEAHNNKKVRNISVTGVGGVEDFEHTDMLEVMSLEREMFGSNKRKHDAYTLMISFSDELDPNKPKDVKTAEKMVKEIVEEAYPHRSAMVALQADGEGGYLHAHVLLNNVDKQGKALRQNGWKHLKKHTDEVTKRYGLEPLTNAKSEDVAYDWRVDLANRIGRSKNMSELEDLGVSYTSRFRKRDKTTQLTFKFTDDEGKKRRIRGGALSKQLANVGENEFTLEEITRKHKERSDIAMKSSVDDIMLDLGGLSSAELTP